MFKSIADVRAANKASGNHFFDKETMIFFRSRIETKLYKGRWFVTSEEFTELIRTYSVREALPNGAITTIVSRIRTKELAIDHIKNYFYK